MAVAVAVVVGAMDGLKFGVGEEVHCSGNAFETGCLAASRATVVDSTGGICMGYFGTQTDLLLA